MDKPQRKLGTKVSPRSAANIRSEARNFRCECNYQLNTCVARLLAALQAIGWLEFQVVEKDEPNYFGEVLGEEEARAYPDEGYIAIRKDIYDQLEDGCGHAKFTIAHELGHLVMHQGIRPSFARGNHEIFEDSEWQADEFASEFLIDSSLVDVEVDTPATVSKRFGVTEHAAEVKLSKLKKSALKAE
ncbi:ImmA/IrrE family metallo-endopeptidase [Vibrio parahaemolyticus]|uniref:ImmA/IrrE family metallo-endopeptidase n=1 Tax=Vibrio harveyi group TaxID=717610 RepID=UPI000472CD66|nr:MULTISPECIES: ImmA/IrrE family metallo-endopeptidase [Vibrio harveyi group]EHR5477003.1 ImmA/IrrE family metallo-endopeptidase [Vibrio parahaemolyticus]EHR6474984.1 ImmA/IrrE family metallo-endopeptidase [Vibrio parahaemolyticus]EJE4558019.1 ImmA/IrrE family metallo-endopeptidase [Vibrio parahaemolyticus]EJG1766262.1 ImmA/IrrE family metallo-endopeptidase [Vibrio parahaemolyticus]ELA7364761.1 ImmA/IrrE family metallo-endopeptidase [Vibrio parahaemolyticus]